MSIWKITEEGPTRVIETKLKKENRLEQELEDWIVADSSLLGEPLLVIGRQVMIPEIKDRIDILALDPQGNSVVVELKRGALKDPVDMQALRYASYISKWGYEDIERQAINFLGRSGDSSFNFYDRYEEFCSDSGVDEVPDLNADQRIMIIGSDVREKLGSVALWLHDHKIDIKVIEISVYREGDSLFLQPSVIIPLPVSRFEETGRPSTGEISRPWLVDGKKWHLEKRCSPQTREIFNALNDIIVKDIEIEGPRWNQKFYVAYRIGNLNWLTVNTRATMLRLRFLVQANIFSQEDLAQRLGVRIFDIDETLEKKIGLPSSILLKSRTESSDQVIFRIKEEFDMQSEAFLEFLDDMHKAFPG